MNDAQWVLELKWEKTVFEATGERIAIWSNRMTVSFDKRNGNLWHWNLNYVTGEVSRWGGWLADGSPVWVQTPNPPEDIAKRAATIRNAILLLA